MLLSRNREQGTKTIIAREEKQVRFLLYSLFLTISD